MDYLSKLQHKLVSPTMYALCCAHTECQCFLIYAFELPSIRILYYEKRIVYFSGCFFVNIKYAQHFHLNICFAFQISYDRRFSRFSYCVSYPLAYLLHPSNSIRPIFLNHAAYVNDVKWKMNRTLEMTSCFSKKKFKVFGML